MTGSSVGVLAALLPALLLLTPSEHEYWLVWPGVALMIGAVTGCGVGLRRGGYGSAGATCLVFGVVLAVLYYAMVFVSDNDGVAMVGVLVIPVLSPLLSPLARLIALVTGDLLRGAWR